MALLFLLGDGAGEERGAKVNVPKNHLSGIATWFFADAFYEWQKSGNAKIPYRFDLKGDGPFTFGGLWEQWRKPDESKLQSFTIITMEANDLARQVHNRMPVILPPEH